LVEKLLESWDSAVEVSRAGLHRKLTVILRQSPRAAAAWQAREEAPSRAGIGA